MSNSSVRITLLEPFLFDREGVERPLEIRYGTGPARQVSANGAIAREGVNVDEYVDAGSFQNITPRAIARFIPGKPMTWDFVSSDPERNGLLVPIEAAMMWFGDWRIPKTARPGTPAEETYGYERNRVATRWGYWQMPRTVSGYSHLRQGTMSMSADMTKIGGVKMPVVHIEDVDNRGMTTGSLSYKPHEHFDFNADVVSEIVQGSVAPGPAIVTGAGLAGLSVDEIRRLLAVAEAAEAMAAQKSKTEKVKA